MDLPLGKYINFTSVTAPPGSGYTDADFETGAFENCTNKRCKQF